jgi:RNA polymerase sigma-54 factor
MDLVLKPKLIQTLKLAMTPQMQQAIKLLQLSRFELVEKIERELGENPTLEEIPESVNEKSIQDLTEFHRYLDSDNYHKKQTSSFEVKETDSFETYTPSKTSLAEHLLWQLMMTSPGPEDEKIGSVIVGSLDDKGYLKSSIEEIAKMSGAEPRRVEKVLAFGARNFRIKIFFQQLYSVQQRRNHVIHSGSGKNQKNDRRRGPEKTTWRC